MIKGKFVSIWDGGINIETIAFINEKTGEIFTESVEVDEVEILDDEYFEDENGNTYEVCPVCHSFIVKIEMKEDEDKNLYESNVCSNLSCEYR